MLLRLAKDARLLGAVAGAVEFFADRAGLDAAARAGLVEAIERASRQTLPLLTSAEAFLDISVTGYADRIEVILEHTGQALPAPGLDSFTRQGAEAESGGGLSLLARVDRVKFETANGVSRTTLIKLLRIKR